MLNDKELDKSIPVPLYYQLKNLISEEIKSGNYSADSLIPTETEIMDMYNVSRTTVRQAILDLVREGALYRVKSKGTFVAKPKISQDFISTRTHSFIAPSDEEIIQSGMTPSTEIINLNLEPMPGSMAELCEVKPNTMAVCLYRKRCASDMPIMRVKTYLPVKSCSFVLEHDFKTEGLYEVLGTNRDTKIYRVSKTCEAVAANRDDVEILGVKRGSPIHFFITIGYNIKDELIEYSLSYFRGDQHRFHVETILNPND
jgi:GntR family transcriptional regulator